MKFISSDYDENTGISTVVMQHLGKKFTEQAFFHPEDKNPSKYAGCRFAEIRAIIKALKYERAIAKNKADMALDFVKSLECYAGFNKNTPEAKLMYRQLNKRIKRVNDLTDKINAAIQDLDISIRQRNIVTNALERKKAKKDNSLS
jgi:hypothetical protein